MSLSAILFFFLVHLGVGITLVLAWVGREAGVKFFRFNAGTAALLIAIGFALRPEAERSRRRCHTRVDRDARRCRGGARRVLGDDRPHARDDSAGAVVDGGWIAASLCVTLQGIDISRDAPGLMPLLTVASFLSSVALLGGACGAMVLGHWYLVVPSLDVSHLQSIVRLHIGSTVVRVVVVAAAVMIAIVTWEPGVPNFERYIFSIDGIFFWQRVLFGLGGPAVLSYLTWETAKIQSTQSATGILYVDFFTVIVGEVLAKYVLLSTKVPV